MGSHCLKGGEEDVVGTYVFHCSGLTQDGI